MPSLLFVPISRITALPCSCFVLVTSFGSSSFCLTLTLFLLHWKAACGWWESTMLSVNFKWALSAAWRFWYISSVLFTRSLFSEDCFLLFPPSNLSTPLSISSLSANDLVCYFTKKTQKHQMRTSILIKVLGISTCLSLPLFAIFNSIDDIAFCLRPFSLTDSIHIFSKSSFQ